MPYVITTLCTNDGACVEVCPVSCIHTTPGAPQFYIDPDVCIDCEQCEIVCPVDAIFKDIDMPAEHKASIDVNAAFFRQNKAAVGPVPFDIAWAMIQAAHEYAQRFGNAVTAVVVDEAGAPIAVGRMDKAEPRTAELAFNKAYTAAAFHLATSSARAASAPTLAAQSRHFAPWAHHARRRCRDDYQRRHARRCHWCGGIEPSRPGRALLPRRHGRVGKLRALNCPSRCERDFNGAHSTQIGPRLYPNLSSVSISISPCYRS